MRSPITHLRGNLAWSNYGTVYATWALTPMAYGMRPMREKILVRDMHRLLLRSLPEGEAMLHSAVVDVDPVAVVQRQIEGIDLASCPDLAEEAVAGLDRLAELRLAERCYWLTIPLALTGADRLTVPVKAGLEQIKTAMDLPVNPPSEDEVAKWVERARSIESALPRVFRPRAVSAAEQIWIRAHAQRRGLLDMPPPTAQVIAPAPPGQVQDVVRSADPLEQLLLDGCAGGGLTEPILDPGARTDEPATKDKGWKRLLPTAGARFNPLSRRVLKVTDPVAMDLGQPASYQALMVLKDTPVAGMVWPGSELLGNLDNLGEYVDWAVRMRITGREAVIAQNRRAARNINDQLDQRSEEMGTGLHDLRLASELLAEYDAQMAADKNEIQVAHTVVLAVAGGTAQEAMEIAERVASEMDTSEIALERPAGAQSRLWWAMQIGAPRDRRLTRFQQITTSAKFALTCPLISSRLGGRRGPTPIINCTTPLRQMAHIDPAGMPEANASGSYAAVGDLGAGKTVLLKVTADGILERGGQMFCIDKSAQGEWATFAATYGDHQVLDLADPTFSMDPLRLFDLHDGAAAAEAFLIQLADISTQGTEGHALGDLLDPDYLQLHKITSLAGAYEHLTSGQAAFDGAELLAERLRHWMRKPVTRVIFDDTLPPVDMTSRAVVWRTHSVRLPRKRQLENEREYRQMSPDSLFGRSYYSLLVRSAKLAGFAHREYFTTLKCDEAYDIFGNPDNADDLLEIGREGRRANFGLGVGSHSGADDMGDPKLSALIPTKYVFRCLDRDLAASNLEWLGMDPSDPDFRGYVETLTTQISPLVFDGNGKPHVEPGREGECYVRDAGGNIGLGKVLLPARPDRAAACLSTPPRRTAQSAS